MAETVLIVDDEASIVQSLHGILSDEGFEVLSADGGGKALELIRETIPDIVLLDNMSPAELREAVECRNARNPDIQLEASGGISLETVHEIASSGVDRISVGALTHSAVWLDIGLDWLPGHV